MSVISRRKEGELGGFSDRTSDIIAIYVYEQGIVSAKYELGTAVGLFNTAINIVLLVIVNRIAKKFGDVNFV